MSAGLTEPYPLSPRPGSYDVAAPRSGQRRAAPAQKGFSVAKRGAELDVALRSELPGPGAYDPYEAPAETKRFQGLDRRAAFQSNSDRFRRQEDQPTASIGPGAYIDVRRPAGSFSRADAL